MATRALIGTNICTVCQQPFQQRQLKKRRKTCSERCATQLRLKKQLFDPREVERFELLVGEFPIAVIAKKMNQFNRKNGLPKRNVNSWRYLANRILNVSVVSDLNNYSLCALADALGLTRGQVDNWQRRHHMPCKKLTGRFAIDRDKFALWALHHAWLLKGVDLDCLSALLAESPLLQPLLTAIKSSVRPIKDTRPKPVFCPQTGQRFSTIQEAAKSAHVSITTMSEYVSQKKRLHGKEFIEVTV